MPLRTISANCFPSRPIDADGRESVSNRVLRRAPVGDRGPTDSNLRILRRVAKTCLGPRIALRSHAAVTEAIQGLPVARDVDEIAANIRNILNTRLSQRPTARPLVILGEQHDCKAALAMNLAAMAVLQRYGTVRFLQEYPAGSCGHDTAQLQRLVESEKDDALMALADGVGPDERPAYETIKTYAARRAGFAVLGFDALDDGVASSPAARPDHEMRLREACMVSNIARQLKDHGAPLLVSTGNFHVPVLHSVFAGQAGLEVIAISMMVPQTYGDTETRRRKADVLSDGRIHKFVADERIERLPLNFVQYISEVARGCASFYATEARGFASR